MNIYTELIEQTKKEMKEHNYNWATLQIELRTLQLAEKMHEEFVETLKRMDVLGGEKEYLILRLKDIDSLSSGEFKK